VFVVGVLEREEQSLPLEALFVNAMQELEIGLLVATTY